MACVSVPMLRQLAMTMITGAARKFSEAMVSSGSLKLAIRMQQITSIIALNTMIRAKLATRLLSRKRSASSTPSRRSRADVLTSRGVTEDDPFLMVTLLEDTVEVLGLTSLSFIVG